MYLDKTISVVIPAYNEEMLIQKTVESVPEFVDKIIVVNDASTDRTGEIVKDIQKYRRDLHLFEHDSNKGVGAAIASGYKLACDLEIDVTAVMAGDAQMDPSDLKHIVEPVANGSVDYTKGNRLFYGDAWKMIPHYRYLGNSTLSLLTKISSGYWHVADSQSGYTAISLDALKKLELDKIYKRYGMPNDLLIRLNEKDFRVGDVPVKPVYNVGEKSGIKLMRVIPGISWILFKGFWRRLFNKYVIRDFHPLVFFYLLSFVLLGASVPLAFRLFYLWAVSGNIPDMNAVALIFTLISGLQCLFFGMWFDMEYNKYLK